MIMYNAITIDLEDWYQGVGIPITEWACFEKRIRIGSDILLNILNKHDVKATFFVLGKVIEDHPDLIGDIIEEGHEIGCHGYSHSELFNIGEQELDNEITKCLELIKPFGIQYKGFRAPYFSVEQRTLWALNVIKQREFVYDASIFPGDNKRTGILNYRSDIHLLDNNLLEVPVTTFNCFSFDFATGGAYFRILPYSMFAKQMEKIKMKQSVIFYLHPWELDKGQPFLSRLSFRRQAPHYANLHSTERKLNSLLSDFDFCPLINILTEQGVA